jgi:hypothetical protein
MKKEKKKGCADEMMVIKIIHACLNCLSQNLAMAERRRMRSGCE